MREKITGTIRKAILVKEALLTDSDLLDKTEEAIRIISEALKGRRRVLFCGNGGSAADAQHLAAELSGKFYLDRTALNAEAINLNIPFLTAVSNDYDYSYSFARYLEGAAAPGDVLLLLSTSGTSPNIVRAARYASAAGIRTIALTGATGEICFRWLTSPSVFPRPTHPGSRKPTCSWDMSSAKRWNNGSSGKTTADN